MKSYKDERKRLEISIDGSIAATQRSQVTNPVQDKLALHCAMQCKLAIGHLYDSLSYNDPAPVRVNGWLASIVESLVQVCLAYGFRPNVEMPKHFENFGLLAEIGKIETHVNGVIDLCSNQIDEPYEKNRRGMIATKIRDSLVSVALCRHLVEEGKLEL